MLGTLAARHEYDWPAAERHLRHALELNPSSAQAHYGLAQSVLAPQERWQEALAENRLASELDPLSPMIAMSEPWLAVLERRHEAAVEGFRKLAAANSTRHDGVGRSGVCARGKGRLSRPPWKHSNRVQRLDAVLPDARLDRLCPGPHGKSRRGAEDSPAIAGRSGGSFHRLSWRCSTWGLGDADEAFRYAEMAREQQESSLIFARVRLRLGPLPERSALLEAAHRDRALRRANSKESTPAIGRSRLIHLLDTPSGSPRCGTLSQ